MSNLAVNVDENDNIISTKSRYEFEKGDIMRMAALWVENNQGQVLLAQRSFEKKHDPGLWGPAAAGTVEPGETYEENIYKEAEEEIGVTDVDLPLAHKWLFWRPDDGTGRYVAMFKATIDKPAEDFVIQTEEVEKVQWFDKETIRQMIKDDPKQFAGSATTWPKELIG